MHQEAIEDGVRYISSKTIGMPTYYFPKCNICGEEVLTINYTRKVKYTCKKCKLNQYLSDKENKFINSLEAKEKKLEQAIKRISAKTKNISKYNKAIDIVKKNLHKYGWFNSTEEIMVAIELLKNNLRVRHQVKFGRYKADFVLPDKKVVLEVDGTIFHTKNTLQKENIRDELILLALGAEWEIVRITDEMINENITRIIPAINKIVQKRKKLRAKDGSLPEWYTDRNI